MWRAFCSFAFILRLCGKQLFPLVLTMSAFRQTARALGKEIPVISAATEKRLMRHAQNPGSVVRKLLPWGVFAGATGAWLVFPTLTEKFKSNPFGIFGEEE